MIYFPSMFFIQVDMIYFPSMSLRPVMVVFYSSWHIFSKYVSTSSDGCFLFKLTWYIFQVCLYVQWWLFFIQVDMIYFPSDGCFLFKLTWYIFYVCLYVQWWLFFIQVDMIYFPSMSLRPVMVVFIFQVCLYVQWWLFFIQVDMIYLPSMSLRPVMVVFYSSWHDIFSKYVSTSSDGCFYSSWHDIFSKYVSTSSDGCFLFKLTWYIFQVCLYVQWWLFFIQVDMIYFMSLRPVMVVFLFKLTYIFSKYVSTSSDGCFLFKYSSWHDIFSKYVSTSSDGCFLFKYSSWHDIFSKYVSTSSDGCFLFKLTWYIFQVCLYVQWWLFFIQVDMIYFPSMSLRPVMVVFYSSWHDIFSKYVSTSSDGCFLFKLTWYIFQVCLYVQWWLFFYSSWHDIFSKYVSTSSEWLFLRKYVFSLNPREVMNNGEIIVQNNFWGH